MISAYILIQVSSNMEREVFSKLEQYDEVENINELFGEWDIIANIQVSSTAELDTFVSDKIRKIKGVSGTSTLIVAR